MATTSIRLRVESLEDRTTPSTLLPGFIETQVNTGAPLSAPTAMAFTPDGRLFVTEQGGSVKVIQNGIPTSVLNLTVNSSGERGLLGIAFDPNFATNNFAYLYYTATSPTIHNRISRFTLSGNAFTAEQVILNLNTLGATNHNGGAIQFGADGMLYAGVGDNAVVENAQSLSNLLGKMLRIDTSAFTGTPDDSAIIPGDNPFNGTATGLNQLIWALGLRNPYSFDVEAGSGRILLNDVGLDSWEEINDGLSGANYGWSFSEGFRKTGDPTVTIGTYNDPLLAYSHGGNPGGCAIVGGAFYDPNTLQFPGSYGGLYFYMDLCGRYIRTFDPDNPGSMANPDPSTVFAGNVVSSPVALTVGPDGSLYYLARGGSTGGVVQRISYDADYLVPKIVIAPDAGGAPVVRTFGSTGTYLGQFYAYGSSFLGGVRVAVAEITGDDTPEIFTAPGPGGAPFVNIFDGSTNAFIRSIQVYGSTFTGGINLAVGDVDPSVGLELLVGAEVGGAPYVNIFNATTGQFLRQILAYGPTYLGGVRVAVGDVDDAGGGMAEVITAPQGGLPVVNIFGMSGLIRQITAYTSTFRGGLFLATGNLDGAGREEIVVGLGPGGPAIARAFTGSTGTLLRTFQAFGAPYMGGVRVGTAQINGDALDDVLMTTGPGGAPYVRIRDGMTTEELGLFLAFPSSVTTGLYIAGLT